MVLAGILAVFMVAVVHATWPALLLGPFGWALTRMDQGAYGKATLGDLARKVAVRNFDRFASMGADARPSAVWRALSGLIADELDLDASRLTPQTRLLA